MTTVHISTPCRLHFGLLRLDERAGRSFGGLGMMIDQPRFELELAAASQWRVTGPAANRAAEFAKAALAALPATNAPAALHIQVASAVPQHRGLGGGTQLALAVAAGVRALVGMPLGTAAELAEAVGRGARSAVGSHGFVHGGLIWERGRVGDSGLAELTAQVPLPEAWRIVLAAPPRGQGLSGRTELDAFARLPPVPGEATRQLEQLAEERILPAARAGAIDEFGEAVHEYGRLSGELFAAVQGGPYASPEIAACVAAIRELGVLGAGQSSWGPTVFAITADQDSAHELAVGLRENSLWAEHEIIIASPDNRGAIVAEVPRNLAFGEFGAKAGRYSSP